MNYSFSLSMTKFLWMIPYLLLRIFFGSYFTLQSPHNYSKSSGKLINASYLSYFLFISTCDFMFFEVGITIYFCVLNLMVLFVNAPELISSFSFSLCFSFRCCGFCSIIWILLGFFLLTRWRALLVSMLESLSPE